MEQQLLGNSSQKGGYLTLLSVLVISAVVMALVLFRLNDSISISQTTIASEEFFRARALAHACAETGILKVKTEPDFSGSNNLTLQGDTCSYTIENTSNSESNLRSSGNAGGSTSKIRVTISKNVLGNGISTTTTISSINWQEVADF